MLNVGIDLGIKSKHVAVAADHTARKVGDPIKFGTSGREIDEMLNTLKKLAPGETSYTFLMEPTPTWRLVGGYLKSLGHEVSLVAQSETHDLRKAIKRHEKSDYLDAPALESLGLKACHSIEGTVANLMERHGPKATICVLPEGPMTIPYVAEVP